MIHERHDPADQGHLRNVPAALLAQVGQGRLGDLQRAQQGRHTDVTMSAIASLLRPVAFTGLGPVCCLRAAVLVPRAPRLAHRLATTGHLHCALADTNAALPT